jgi:hypothetical protein
MGHLNHIRNSSNKFLDENLSAPIASLGSFEFGGSTNFFADDGGE